MRFSVLLPTREGGALLENCVRSVLDQNRDDVELVVADNANTDETAEVLDRHRDDDRLVVTRSERPLPVTENWQASLDRSSGEYVVLLNDDDLLLPGYFDRADALLRDQGDPDCLTTSAYYYVFPDAAMGEHRSFYRDPAFPDEGETVKRELGRDERMQRIRLMFADYGFGHCFPGLQRTLVSRAAIARLRAGLFRPPYPDLYGLGALFLTARSWTVTPEKLLVLGAGPRSFWHLHFSGRPEEAVAYLLAEPPAGRLPGDETLNTMALNLERLKRDYPAELAGIEPNETLYVTRQVWAWMRQARAGRTTRAELRHRLRALPARDLLRLAGGPLRGEAWRTGASAARAHLRGASVILSEGFAPLAGVGDIAEFADWIAAGGSADRAEWG